MKVSREDWGPLLALLDQALELAAGERDAFLAAQPPARQESLRALLAQRSALEDRQFLNELPALAVDPDPVPSRVGTRIGPYLLGRELGSGGMASVYVATRADGAHAREVALKLPFLGPRSGVLGQRFARECQILSTLRHPNIAGVLDAGVDGGQPWLALDYVRGEPITAWATTHSLDLSDRLRLFLQVLRAVQHAHSQLVIHRDLKPSNVLVDEHGAVKLLDFGVAKLLSDDGSSAVATQLTELGGRALTPQYASPEQLAGQALGTTSDVYSLGVLLYELLTGRLPYVVKRASLAAMEEAVLAADLRAPSSMVDDARLVRSLRGDVDTIVLKALQREPDRRYASAEAMALDLQRHLNSEPIEARPSSVSYRLGKTIRRHRGLVAAASVSLTALLGGLGLTLWQASEARQQARRAEAAQAFLIDMIKGSDARIARDKPRGTTTAKEMLDLNVDRIESAFANDVETQLELLGLAGEIYGHLGEDEKSQKLLSRQGALALAAHGPNHPVVIRSLLLDAWGSIEQQDYQAALRTLDDVGERIEKAHLADTIIDAERWLAKSEALRATAGAGPARLAANEKAIAVYERVDPTNDYLIAALANAGTALLAGGRYAEARAHYERALAVSEKSPNRDDNAMAVFWRNLSIIQEKQGDTAAVEQSLERAMALARATTGEHDSVYWSATVRLAGWVSSRGERDRAEALFAALLPLVPEKWERTTEHAQVWHERGESLFMQGAAKNALPWLERAHAIFVVRPYRENDLRQLRLTLGQTLLAAGKPAQAKLMLSAARDEFLRKERPPSASLVEARVRWAEVLDPDAAQVELRAAIEDSQGLASAPLALAWVARSRLALERFDLREAVFAGRYAVKILAAVTEAVDVRVAPTVQLALAEALAASGEFDEAHSLAVAAATVLEHSDVELSPLRLRAAHCMVSW